MEPMVIKDIKTSVIKESINECYLNPKDNIINEHYNQLLFKNLSSNLLFYLPLNELLVLVLEEKLIIYDLKISITENLRILDEIFYTKDIISNFIFNIFCFFIFYFICIFLKTINYIFSIKYFI